MRPALAAAFAVLLLAATPLWAEEWMVFAWEAAGITLTLPRAWTASPVTGDTPTLNITDNVNLMIQLRVLESGDPAEALTADLPALDLVHFGFEAATLYGRAAWRAEAVTANRAYFGEGRVGYLPDDRLIVAVARWTGETLPLDQVFAGLSLTQPILPAFQAVWTHTDHALTQVTYSANGVVYALYGGDEPGVLAISAADGAVIGAYPFVNPTQPTDITADASGTVYVADIVCRCVLRLQGGAWLDPVGAYAGNAPLGVAVAPDGTVYAIDRYKDNINYALNILGADDPIPLNFNATAPPFVLLDADGRPLLVERLASLLDQSLAGYLSTVENDGTLSGFWLPDSAPLDADPLDVTGDGRGGIIIAGATIVYETLWGTRETLLAVGGRSAALSEDGLRLFVVDVNGGLTGYSKVLPTDRGGAPLHLSGAGVGYGTLSEATPRQVWTYQGHAGETVTINAIDPSLTDPLQLNLDMAVRVSGPTGAEIAYNDDQLGLDLFGAYDAQIADLVLPADGVYTVAVEWVQGGGAYLLSVRSDQWAAVGADNVIRVAGALIDAAPVERWAFAGSEGDVITLTMITQSGDLDPALELLGPDGARLAYNDDTTDAAMGVNAQISRVRLPATGTYIVEASRFDGSGRYELVILQVE